jgi:hypothetical protein
LVSKDQLRFIPNPNKWKPGTELTWSLIEPPPNDGDEEIIGRAFEEWSKICYVRFRRMDDNDVTAKIRIGFSSSGGCWSYLGTDILRKKYSNQKTMNFSCALFGRLSVALHEIGHTLGFSHEHQNPLSGIEWNVEEVNAQLQKIGWDREAIEHNILRKNSGDLETLWDPLSVMNLGFGPNCICEPKNYETGIDLPEGFSPQDILKAQKYYPFPVVIQQSPKSDLSIGQDKILKVHLHKDEPILIRLEDNLKSNEEFHIAVLLMKSADALVQMALNVGSEVAACGSSSSPIKYSLNNTNRDCFLALKCSNMKENEITATVTVY